MKLGFRLALSVAAGVVAALLMSAFAVSLSARSDQERDKAMGEYGGRLTRVLVAKRDIKAGSSITSALYERRSWVSELLPSGAVSSAAQLRGAKASAAIYGGEPIIKGRIAQEAEGGLDVPVGLVAVSIPVQTDLAVGGAIRGGDHVSIVVYDGIDGAKRLADNVLVLATNTDDAGSGDKGGIFSSGSDPAGLTWATLAVRPQLELPLVNVSESARIHLTVHGEGDSAAASSTAAK